MEAVLTASGSRPGAATSPHLLRFNERIRVAGRNASDAEIVDAFAAIDAARGSISLTYFEFGMLASLLVFRRQGAGPLLLEVGLGGRLDAANIIDPDIAVITAIDLDHQAWLGDSREQIAREKAGILRPGIPAVIADPDPPGSLLAALAEQGCGVWRLGRDFQTLEAEDSGSWTALLRNRDGSDLALPGLPPGPLLPGNVAAALQALVTLGVRLDPAQARDVLAGLRLRGRRESLRRGGCEYLLDVAHNPAAAAALRDYLRQRPAAGRSLALFAPMADKDIAGILDACLNCFDGWYLADQPGIVRASRAADTAALLRQRGGGVIGLSGSVREALELAGDGMRPGDRLVIFGSFLPVAAAMAYLDREREAAGG
jgi:dihydrofolate synthase/folylpolyglutamate synthase